MVEVLSIVSVLVLLIVLAAVLLKGQSLQARLDAIEPFDPHFYSHDPQQ